MIAVNEGKDKGLAVCDPQAASPFGYKDRKQETLLGVIAGTHALFAIAAIAALTIRNLDAIQLAHVIVSPMLATGHVTVDTLVVVGKSHLKTSLRLSNHVHPEHTLKCGASYYRSHSTCLLTYGIMGCLIAMQLWDIITKEHP